MKIQLKKLAATAALITAIISAPSVYANGTSKSPGSMMGQGGMMQGEQMSPGMMQGGQGGQMGQGGMMGMMEQMSQMMENCNKMMRPMNHDGSGEPNEQWRKDAPEPDKTPK